MLETVRMTLGGLGNSLSRLFGPLFERLKLPPGPRRVWLFLLFLILVITAGLPLLKLKPEPTPDQNIAEPSASRPLATGKQTYLISGSTEGAPKMSEITFDPIDPQPNQNQTVKVKALGVNGSSVKTVTVTLNTDNRTETYSLSLVEGTGQEGFWQGSWKISDSYDYRYAVTFRAENAAGKAQLATVTLR